MKNKISNISKLEVNNDFVPCQPNDEDELFPNGIFVFNISKIIDYIKHNKDKVELSEVNVRSICTFSSLNESYIDSLDISKPVILSEISPGNYNLIDGHHRLEKARRTDRPTIMAYKLTVDQHINFLTSETAYLSYVEYWNNKVEDYVQLLEIS